MTLAELLATTPVERWRSLSPAAQERIGAKLLEHVFAELVAEDDGTETTKADRAAADEIRARSFNELFPIVEAAFPQVMWTYPDNMGGYEVRDRNGTLLGLIELEDDYVFVPAGAGRRKRASAECMPSDCLPAAVLRAVRAGGSCLPFLKSGTA